mmetsp:Transcript_518/g.1156  ORF Transcript_518/g.1156 Transcript_518/m.1156 type:complete len:133 (+) Transcript_518:1637-2035(+)
MSGDADRDSLGLRSVFGLGLGDVTIDGTLLGLRDEGGLRLWWIIALRKRASVVIGAIITKEGYSEVITVDRHSAATQIPNFSTKHRHGANVLTLPRFLILVSGLDNYNKLILSYNKTKTEAITAKSSWLAEC